MPFPRSVLAAPAIVFAVAATFYSLCWIYYIRHDPPVMLGIVRTHDVDQALRLQRIVPGGGAEQAGLQIGDRIVAINGEADDLPRRLHEVLYQSRAGDTIELRIERAGWETPRDVQAVLQARDAASGAPEGLPQWLASEVLTFYPIPFLVVGIGVLLLRPDDRNAWLLALVFAGFIAGAPIWQLAPRIPEALARWLFAWSALFSSLMPGVFYFFFSTFPARSPIDRRLPWLKVVLVATGTVLGILFAAVALAGGPQALGRLYLEVFGGPSFSALSPAGMGLVGFALAGQLLGLASLTLNAFGAPETRRKVRVIVAGAAAGLLPGLTVQVYAASRGIFVDQLPFWVWSSAILALFLVPLSLAYAVVKHQVLELPVLLRRSARYVLVRRGVVTLAVLIALGATLLLTELLARYIRVPELGRAAGLAFGAAAGLIVGLAAVRALQPITTRIDRAFFRESYDARQIMQSLAGRSRTVNNRTQLVSLLERSLSQALHPAGLAVLLRNGNGDFVAAGEGSTGVGRLDAREAARLGLPGAAAEILADNDGSPVRQALERVTTITPALIVPMQGRDADLEGLIVLGPRLSEEPYSGEDRELIGSVATQAGMTLENIRLAESMAERMEAERRSLREMEIARDVQLKLLPQRTPVLATLECAGICLQARAVGGDYYDFLELDGRRTALVLADVSGKGISAALLMASLQANLRAQYAQPAADLERVLATLNRIFFESTSPSHYATVFLGVYDEATRRLLYANCGHPPPVLRRVTGARERLACTAPVVGLFDEWHVTSREVDVRPGDTLVIFSDGVTDALNDEGEEFGEERLLQLVREHPDASADRLLQSIVSAVNGHASAALFDDLTLVVARGRA